jgi:predicted GTPase
MSDDTQRVVILGAAGRDFHDFLTWFRTPSPQRRSSRRPAEQGRSRDPIPAPLGDSRASPQWHVVAFTAEQIPGIAGRRFPAALAGDDYPEGIPIVPEAQLEQLIAEHAVDWVCLAYSDLAHQTVMEKASRVLAAGAKFMLLPGRDTWVASTKPVVAVTAVRTGCGKSQTARAIAEVLRRRGLRPVAIRHSMPYGADLTPQACQRFASAADFARHHTTIEEEEEYQPWLDHGFVVFAGFDYQAIVPAAEAEGDVLVFDGGNNDQPLVRPDVHVVVVDPHRPGHENTYYPGFVNLLTADVVVINKVDSAPPDAIERVAAAVREHRPQADVVRARSVVEGPAAEVRGRRCVVVGDGPTLTHGGMTFGAGTLFARRQGAEIVDPRPFFAGSLREVLVQYPHLEYEVPAMGYGSEQVRDLEATLAAVPADVVVDGSPADLGRLLRLDKPIVQVRYELDGDATAQLGELLRRRGIA